MKASLSWLRDYVSIEMKVDSLADALTMAGLEVETVSDRYDSLDSVVVGRVIKIDPHPNADGLKLCDVDTGDHVVHIVCGAPNVKKDILAPVAMPGAIFPDRSLLERRVIRGKTSEAMLCSEAKLGLGTDSNGIMILNKDLKVGSKIAQALELSDRVFEIDLTPNRPDCLSIIGIAREIAALQKTRVRYPRIDTSYDFGDNISNLTSVTIKAPERCRRYAARLLFDITVSPSPFWLQDRLMSIGLKPVNNIVDITNFVMIETGQPLHAFDFDRLADNRIVVRAASEGETFVTLDQKERHLSPEMLMICDGKKPVALAGIMGGLNSEIDESTRRILIESAYFDPVSVRKTSRALNLSTESSLRFERGVDPNGIITALNRAALLMAKIEGSRLIDGIIDEYPKAIEKKPIVLSARDSNRLLGVSLGRNEISNLLQSIEFEVEKDDSIDDQDRLIVTPPSFRVDIERPVDLMEEIARLSGYNNIPTTSPLTHAEARQPAKQLGVRDSIKRLMIGFGFAEAINYSFINRLSCDRLGLSSDDTRRRVVDILNPLTEDQGVMRTSLIPGLLETLHRNIAQQVRNLKLFEIGKIYIGEGQDSLPEEIEMLAGLWVGTRFDTLWHSKGTDADFYDIKGVVEGLLDGLSIDNGVFTAMTDSACDYTRSGYTASIRVKNEILGLVGELHPQTLRNFDLSCPVFIFELNLDSLIPLVHDITHSRPIPKFPAVFRDITIIVNKDIETGGMLENIRDAGAELLENVYLFDIFEDDPIPPEKKSVSFRITYRSHRKTLEDDEVNHIHKAITDRLLRKFDATLPAR